MIRVNLLLEEERERHDRPALLKVPRRGFWLTLALSIAVLAPIVGIGVMQRYKIATLKEDIGLAEAEARRLKPQIERIQVLMKERQDLNQRLVTIQDLGRDRYLPVQMMDEIAAETPEYLWFTRVEQKAPGAIELEGMTFSNTLVAELMMRLEERDIFQDVALSVSERAKVGDGKVVRFVLTSSVKP
ncbi:MAG: hypothetical protein FJY88_00655 [Candidatus Eisenbacteria bacterium]|nr:hypothetical protein [Candidatus Eisenbacteria bacterium]